MSGDGLRELTELAAVVRGVEEAGLRVIASEEARVRERLAMLDDHGAAAAVPSDQTTLALRSVGADLLWRGWVARTRRELQIELARILARKGEALRQLRRAHGRSQAAEALQADARRAERARLEHRRLLQEQNLQLLRPVAHTGRD